MSKQQRPQDSQSSDTGSTKKQWVIVGLIAVVLVIVVSVVAPVLVTKKKNSNSSSSSPAPPTSWTNETTVAPTPSLSDRASGIRDVVNSATLTFRRLLYPSQATPEEQALQWLIEQDLSTNSSDTLSILQRFALSTMWFANGPFSDFPMPHSDTWLSSMEECNWESVKCLDGKVTELEFVFQGLSGNIPADVGLLNALTALTLVSNFLTGTIPSQLGELTALEALGIFGNLLTGTIPSEISKMTSLRSLSIDTNQLTGSVPVQLTLLTSLNLFTVYGNDLNGTMPFCDGNSSQVENLQADCQEIHCPCCTRCCSGGFSTCVDN